MTIYTENVCKYLVQTLHCKLYLLLYYTTHVTLVNHVNGTQVSARYCVLQNTQKWRLVILTVDSLSNDVDDRFNCLRLDIRCSSEESFRRIALLILSETDIFFKFHVR